jgi:capsular exopolysaccharide synthesis family protein
MSRVLDALRQAGVQAVGDVPKFAAFADVAEVGFKRESAPIVQMRPEAKSGAIFLLDPQGLTAERYRLLQLGLHTLRAQATLRTILITSPGDREGKSTVALNLAAALAEKGKESVLLLEADLRRPTLAHELGLPLASGLSQCKRTELGLLSVICKVEPLGFYFVPAGGTVSNPVELLNSEWFAQGVENLASCFDWVLIDSPPVIPVVDAVSLRDRADASLVVVRAGLTQQAAIDEAIRVLRPDHVCGVLLNGVENFDRRYAGYYRSEKPQTKKRNRISSSVSRS